MNECHYAVILAGGRGERFWPLSTAQRPKQLLSLVGDRPLLAQAVDRLDGLVPPERVLVVTNADLVEATLEAATELPPENVIGEPMGRDTAAAVALASALVRARRPDGVFAILTADQVMGDLRQFRATLRESLELAGREDVLVTIGIQPSEPRTSFGYIEAGESVGEHGGIAFFRAKRFVEKPDRGTAEHYVEAGRYYWNAGMFIWSVAALRTAFERHAPCLLQLADRVEPSIGRPDFAQVVRGLYEPLDKISIDYALMERAENIVMARGTFAWDDVGSWPALAGHFPPDEDGNVAIGRVAAIDSSLNIVVSNDRLTALIGVQGLVVVQAEGATLICPRERAQEVKQLVAHLRESGGHEEVL